MRNKSMTAVEEEINQQAKALFEEFKPFTTGTRYLSLLHRSKDGGHNKEYHRRGGFFIVHDQDEYLAAIVRLLTLKVVSGKPYRLYASVNGRDIKKGEKQFKMEMLEADFASGENHDFFWTRLESRWVGALMKPGSRSGSLFMIDADGGEEVHAPCLKWLSANNVDIFKQYKTPNGWHIITAPFNPTGWNVEGATVVKDGLMLLAA